ncbi:MAG: acyclic terpene utilization AtuA family protein, partial [Gammaproteobacteria bacterium]
MSEEIIRIGNCSGYYGDKLSAAKDMVEGGPLDVLTGDYLAELTMTILFNQKMQRGEDKGYVGTFLKQVKAVAETCKEKNIKIVTNAGGLNPSSMANEIEKILEELGISLKVAYITGDDLMPRMDTL